MRTDADLTDLPFVTVDPPGSTDLDQAMFLSRQGEGFHLDHAIADVPWLVPPGGLVAAEAMRRGQTLYAPDSRTPLHPPALSAAAASLLPNLQRPAFGWRFDLDARARVVTMDLQRALVRSRHRLDYAQVQAAADAAGPDQDPTDLIAGQAVLLRAIGQLRLELERERGGAPSASAGTGDLRRGGDLPDRLRPVLSAEDWNAQLSLMTGRAAAQLMIQARIGLLRTLPGLETGVVERFRRQATARGMPWPAGRRVRARHRCAAPTGRPVRAGDQPCDPFRGAGPGPGARGAAGPAEGDVGVRALAARLERA